VIEADDRETILVVDDFKANVEFFTAILEGEYRVISAYEGETAISRARSEHPDLVLLDIMMPGLDGYEVCRELKADLRTKSIPVIFVTALGEVEDEARAFEAGGADFITKPARPLVVLARVKTQLALQGQMRVLESMVRERTAELEQARFEIIRRLGRAAEFRDNETGLHVIRMSLFGERIARAYGLSDGDAELYLHALPMHDIGKIGIRDSILLKPGKLDASETAEMRKHCEIGARILGDEKGSKVESLAVAAVCALTHHERWDGRGYPHGLSGAGIPLIGRVAAVADVFDALTSKRPYKEPWPIGRAAAEIQDGSGSQFDPEVVKAFAKALPEVLEIRERYLET